MAPVTNPVLAERYANAVATPSDINEHLPTFVRTVEELNATRVLEIGVRYGLSSLAWLFALEGRGQLWSVDCSWPVAAPGTDVNLLDPQGPLGIVPHWLFLMGYCEWQSILDALPDEFDCVFLDANHGHSETLEQLRLFIPRVRSGGRFLLHDTDLAVSAIEGEPPYPVRTAMEQYCAEHGLRYENNPACSGLGTIYC